MVNRTLPVVMNAVIPGSGLWYLGLRRMAVINLLAAVLIPLVGMFWLSEHVHYLFLGVAAGSAGAAHAAVLQLSRQQRSATKAGRGEGNPGFSSGTPEAERARPNGTRNRKHGAAPS